MTVTLPGRILEPSRPPGLTVKGTSMKRRPPANRILLAVGALAFVIGLVLGKDQGDAETTSNTISAVLLTLGFLMVVAGAIVTTIGTLRSRRAA